MNGRNDQQIYKYTSTHTHTHAETCTQSQSHRIRPKTNNRDAMWLIITNAERQLKSTTNKSRPLINKL